MIYEQQKKKKENFLTNFSFQLKINQVMPLDYFLIEFKQKLKNKHYK